MMKQIRAKTIIFTALTDPAVGMLSWLNLTAAQQLHISSSFRMFYFICTTSSHIDSVNICTAPALADLGPGETLPCMF